MKNSLPLLTIITCALLATGLTVSASQHGGSGKQGFESGTSQNDGKQRSEAEQSVRKRMEQSASNGRTEQERERLEKEMEKRTRQESTSGDASKNREQTRTTEEMHKESGKGSDMAEPARETSRQWWEFWK
ncbi:MAG: hypothetical protein KAT25_00165 [Sulfuriflexus sp.]|nr:hypothetical protein [Sulfuriflexus sp.]